MQLAHQVGGLVARQHDRVAGHAIVDPLLVGLQHHPVLADSLPRHLGDHLSGSLVDGKVHEMGEPVVVGAAMLGRVGREAAHVEHAVVGRHRGGQEHIGRALPAQGVGQGHRRRLGQRPEQGRRRQLLHHADAPHLAVLEPGLGFDVGIAGAADRGRVQIGEVRQVQHILQAEQIAAADGGVGDLAAVFGRGLPAVVGDQRRVGRHASEPDPDVAVALGDREAADVGGAGRAGHAGREDAAPVRAEPQAMVIALHRPLDHAAERQRDLAMRAAVLQDGHLPRRRAEDHHRLFQQHASERLVADLAGGRRGPPLVIRVTIVSRVVASQAFPLLFPGLSPSLSGHHRSRGAAMSARRLAIQARFPRLPTVREAPDTARH